MLHVPPPLRGADPDSFARSTVTSRMPALARRARLNPEVPAAAHPAIEALAAELPHAPIRHLDDPHAPDLAGWRSLVDPHAGASWLEVPWLFAEFYLFRRVLEATGFFGDGPGAGVDPYGPDKEASLAIAEAPLRALAEAGLLESPPTAETLRSLLKASLWGNQADLSLWQAGEGPGHELIDRDKQLLADDTGAVAAWLAAAGGRLDMGVVVDNAGEEFTMDLALVDALLRLPPGGRVTLHVKAFPTYVSDVTPRDVDDTLAAFRASAAPHTRRLAARLDAALAAGRLLIQPDPVWAQPHPFRRLPDGARATLGRHDFLIFKGDANYRRLLDDSHWPATTPFASIVAYFDTPLLALRTCKAEVIAGLDAQQIARLHALDPHWKINGRWAVAQAHGIPGR
ncbi:MAG: damage-control phosphatase ARMT1 family protein [Rhodothermales bacterium]|nr:damage-control phosphatase ARMT1 family protein [Rhodothermales bacterium]